MTKLFTFLKRKVENSVRLLTNKKIDKKIFICFYY